MKEIENLKLVEADARHREEAKRKVFDDQERYKDYLKVTNVHPD